MRAWPLFLSRRALSRIEASVWRLRAGRDDQLARITELSRLVLKTGRYLVGIRNKHAAKSEDVGSTGALLFWCPLCD
jgi:hypothetical protein